MTEAMDATDAPSGLFDRSRAIRSARIPAGAKLVLEAIADCGEACFLKQQTMAIKTGLGLRAVSKWISWLKDAGIVESTRTGRSSHYSVSWRALASAGDTNQGAHQMRTSVRIRCAPSCVSDAHERSYQMRTSVRIASDSINGPSNGSRNEHPNAVVAKEDSRSMTGSDLCREWYRRTGRSEPMRPDKEEMAVERLLAEYGEAKVRPAMEESIVWVRDRNQGVRYLAGDLGRIEEKLRKFAEDDRRRKEQEAREQDRRIEQRARDEQWRQEQKRKHDHWRSLSDEERAGRIAATRAGFPNSLFANDWFVEMQSISEAWEDHVSCGNRLEKGVTKNSL